MWCSTRCTSVNRRAALAAVAGMLLAARAGAQVPSLPMPPEVQALSPALQLAGSGKLTYFTLDVYRAALWVPPDFRASGFEQYRFALALTYLRSLNGQAIAKRSLAEMQRSASLSEAQATTWLAAMQAAFPDVSAGDRITGIHRPFEGAAFMVNGKARARIADPLFAKHFFGIWLTPATSEPELRQALLAKAQP